MDTNEKKPEEKELEKAEEISPELSARKETFRMLGMVGDGFDEEIGKLDEEKREEQEKPAEKKESEKADEDPPVEDPPEEKPEEPKRDDPGEKKEEEKKPEPPAVEVHKDKEPPPDIPPFEPEAASKRTAAPPPPPSPTDDPKAQKKPADNDGLNDDEREEIEIAQWADKLKPGIEQKVRDFIRERREFVAAKVKEEGRGYRPSRDPEYRDWLDENNPLPANQRRKWETQKLREEIRQELEQGTSKTQAELKRELEALRLKPQIEKKAANFRKTVETALPDTLKEVFPEIEEMDGAVKEMRPIVDPVTERYSALAETLLALNAGVETYDPKNRNHTYIGQFLDSQARYFEANAGPNLFRDGKRFVRPDVWPQVPAEKQHLYWTFSEDDLVAVFAEKSRMETRKILKAEREKYERFKKLQPKKEEAKGKKKPDGNKSPPYKEEEDLGVKATTSQSPGAGSGGDSVATPPSFLGFLNTR